MIRGVENLSGAPVRAHDIRAGAALVVAALRAQGQTEIRDPSHIDRGYENLVENLSSLGADITRRIKFNSLSPFYLLVSTGRREE
ncbi:MAG: hypothetical protein Ct9H90mP5_04540 [Acidimicrobiaceae bacterium]|nr:MAG: hypothetical protein Ct9H90mP5_04540 [Acidimicrobiaceae bacterium]